MAVYRSTVPLKVPIKAEAPMSTYKKKDAGSWQMAVTIKGGRSLSDSELITLRAVMSEVSFLLEQWRQTLSPVHDGCGLCK